MDATIRELIRAIVGDARTYAIRATVTAVNGNTCTVSPLNGGPEIPDVKLITNSGNGLLITPAINSVVEVVKDGPFTAFVAQYSEIESITLDVNTTIVINGGSNDGLVNVNDLVTKLNNLENDINDLKTAFSSWIVVPNDGGAALKTISASWYGSPLVPTIATDIEDPNVKH
jgi:hypothetical protein